MALVHLDDLSYSYAKRKYTIIYFALNFMTLLNRLFWSKKTKKKVENESGIIDSSYQFGRSSNC